MKWGIDCHPTSSVLGLLPWCQENEHVHQIYEGHGTRHLHEEGLSILAGEFFYTVNKIGAVVCVLFVALAGILRVSGVSHSRRAGPPVKCPSVYRRRRERMRRRAPTCHQAAPPTLSDARESSPVS